MDDYMISKYGIILLLNSFCGLLAISPVGTVLMVEASKLKNDLFKLKNVNMIILSLTILASLFYSTVFVFLPDSYFISLSDLTFLAMFTSITTLAQIFTTNINVNQSINLASRLILLGAVLQLILSVLCFLIFTSAIGWLLGGMLSNLIISLMVIVIANKSTQIGLSKNIKIMDLIRQSISSIGVLTLISGLSWIVFNYFKFILEQHISIQEFAKLIVAFNITIAGISFLNSIFDIFVTKIFFGNILISKYKISLIYADIINLSLVSIIFLYVFILLCWPIISYLLLSPEYYDILHIVKYAFVIEAIKFHISHINLWRHQKKKYSSQMLSLLVGLTVSTVLFNIYGPRLELFSLALLTILIFDISWAYQNKYLLKGRTYFGNLFICCTFVFYIVSTTIFGVLQNVQLQNYILSMMGLYCTAFIISMTINITKKYQKEIS